MTQAGANRIMATEERRGLERCKTSEKITSHEEMLTIAREEE